MKHPRYLSLLLLIPPLLVGCAPASASAPDTPTPAISTPTEPTPTPAAGGLTLHYEENAQVELVSPTGIRVMIDVCNPAKLISPPTADDVLLSTHTHSDHYSESFAQEFPGQAMVLAAGELETQDMSGKAILSAGAWYDDQVPDSNTLYVIDIGGLRVAHLGDIAQAEFTPEQLAVLQDIDIVITVLDSAYGDMTLENLNGFSLMEQIKPKLIIPTHHVSGEGIEYAAQKWGGYAHKDPLHITRENLPAETKLLVMGQWADAYKKLYNLQDWQEEL